MIWDNFQRLVDGQFEAYKIYKNTDDQMKVKTSQSIITLERQSDQLLLSIERRVIDIIPDRGHNYLLLQRIIENLQHYPV